MSGAGRNVDRVDTAARPLVGSILAILLAACSGSSSSPAGGAQSGADSASVTYNWRAYVYIEQRGPAQPIAGSEANYPSTPTFVIGSDIDDAYPADVDPAGVNEIDVEERKVVTVVIATMTDALQRALGGGPDDGVGLRSGSFAAAWGPQLTLTLIDCAFTTDVKVSGMVTWAQSTIWDGGFHPANRPLTADFIISGPGTAGGTLHVAGSWLSNDPNHYFSVTGTLGGKKVAVLVPEA